MAAFRDLLGQKFGRLLVVARAPSARKRTMWRCRCDCSREKVVRASHLTRLLIRSCGCICSAENLTGRRFGSWLVLGPSAQKGRWRCVCVCGTVKIHQASNLRTGSTKSCGCAIVEKVIAAGARFGQLTALDRVGREKPSKWRLRCDCGNETVAFVFNLAAGRTKSCGCSVIRHGHARNGRVSGEYISWRAMLSRCTNPSSVNWQWYGGSGISVCPEWRDSFEAFYRDLGPRPPGTTLDRFPDRNGHYEKGNCRYATPEEQANNRRNNRRVAYNGEVLTIAQWSRRTGIPKGTLRSRLAKGWSFKRAIERRKAA
jgi:hypothetical protein